MKYLKKIKLFGRYFYVNILTKQDRKNRKGRIKRIRDNKISEIVIINSKIKNIKKSWKSFKKSNKDKISLHNGIKNVKIAINHLRKKYISVSNEYGKDIKKAKCIKRKTRFKGQTFIWYRILFWEIREIES